MKVQWNGDNLPDIERLLACHEAQVHPSDNQSLRITGPDGLDVLLGLGDSIKLRGDSIGIVRAVADPGKDVFVVWAGDNAGEISHFIKDWDEVDMQVIGNTLTLDWTDDGQRCRVLLDRGDRIIRRGRYLFVSRGGKDHRV